MNLLLIWRIIYPAMTTYYLHSVYHTDKIVLSLNSPESWQKTYALYILGDEGAITFSNAWNHLHSYAASHYIPE